ncbi:MAG: CDP-diacylglycerol--serine O-phosphatidyltransferase, partial [Elusimicrobia bacterium]|nr:CDP-diacylglycerol--serine O-phosphatidyltransferase [Elusimicrobiota bacterium]
MKFGIYLASIITIANMASGMYSILNSIQQRYTAAAWLILLSVFLDGIDGIVARATRTTSLLGVELDSFSDFVSFCIAPVVMMYFIVLKQLGVPGMAVGFVYIVFGALRLAKFNIISFDMKSPAPYFEGLPTTAAGGILASFVLIFELFERFEQGLTHKAIPVLMNRVPFIFEILPVVILILGFLMVSKLRYTAFSKLKASKRMSLRFFLLLIVAVLLIVAYPENIIFVIFVTYLISGIVNYFWRMYQMSRKGRRHV